METKAPAVPPTDPNLAARHIAALDFEFAKSDVMERLRFQADFAKVAWQSLSLVNGGAIVALFTFIGHAKPELNSQSHLWVGFVCFAVGLAINIASIVFGFMSQAYFMRGSVSATWNEQAKMHGHEPQHVEVGEREMMVGNRWHALALTACVLSLVAFIVGAAFSLAGVA